jgi:tetratricopeptide (TPR) repeat protein
MDIGTKIKTLLKEAELYKGQGLLNESKSCYQNALKLIKSIDKLKNKDKLLYGIAKKLKSLSEEIDRVESAPDNPEIGEESQELIKKLFSYAKTDDEDAMALEEAITLTKFGQYEKAIKDFTALLEKESVRLAAAKNILRCYIASENIDGGIEKFQEWLGDDTLNQDQLKKLGLFFQSIIDKKGLDVKVPDAAQAAADSELELDLELEEAEVEPVEAEAGEEEEILDINSVGISFESGPKKGEVIELDVSFQTGNVISVLLNARDKELIESLNPGDKLNDMQFYSPIAIFQGTGVVNAKTAIKVGPRKGDYSVDIKVSSS